MTVLGLSKVIGDKRIWLKGSRQYIERIVYKRKNGTYFCHWSKSIIDVYNVDGYENVTSGWVTVEEV